MSKKKGDITKKDITEEQARQIAQKRVKGDLEGGDLKTEKGRSVYEFQGTDAKGRTVTIWVAQKDGKVVRKSVEKMKAKKK